MNPPKAGDPLSRMLTMMDPATSMIRFVETNGNLHLSSISRLGATGGITSSRRALFLDRDGVLVKDVHYLTKPEQLEILPGVIEGIRNLQDRYFIVVITNQSGIARGFLTEEELLSIHDALAQEFHRQGAIIDALYFCPHHPEADVPKYRMRCECRKPLPGMFLQAASDWNIDLSQSVMLGDMPWDAHAARAAGVTPIMVGEEQHEIDYQPIVAADLLSASVLIDSEDSKIPGSRRTPEIVATTVIQSSTEKDVLS